MTLCDPFAINFLATSALKIMNHQVDRDGMPRENAVLHLLLRMLTLGLSAWEMIETQEVRQIYKKILYFLFKLQCKRCNSALNLSVRV